MSLTKNTKLKELVNNPEALAIINKYMPIKLDPDDPRLKPALDMSLKVICGFPQTGIKKEDAEKMFEELEDADLD